jgi:FMN phosphatase YigB (HAD superfamily)
MPSVPPSSPPQIVCFDLGGVLIRICHGWEEACRRANLSPPNPDEATSAARRALFVQHQRGGLSLDEWAEAMVRLDGTHTPDELRRAHAAILIDEEPGARALVDELHESGMGTAALSNTNEAHWLRLRHRDGTRPRVGTPEYPAVARLHSAWASHRLGVAKPEPAIYEQFEALSGVRGRGILFFDDRAENVAAALDHGWRAECVDRDGDPIAQIRVRLRQEGVLR